MAGCRPRQRPSISRLLPEASGGKEDGHAGGVWPGARPFGRRGWLEEGIQPQAVPPQCAEVGGQRPVVRPDLAPQRGCRAVCPPSPCCRLALPSASASRTNVPLARTTEGRSARLTPTLRVSPQVTGIGRLGYPTALLTLEAAPELVQNQGLQLGEFWRSERFDSSRPRQRHRNAFLHVCGTRG